MHTNTELQGRASGIPTYTNTYQPYRDESFDKGWLCAARPVAVCRQDVYGAGIATLVRDSYSLVEGKARNGAELHHCKFQKS